MRVRSTNRPTGKKKKSVLYRRAGPKKTSSQAYVDQLVGRLLLDDRRFIGFTGKPRRAQDRKTSIEDLIPIYTYKDLNGQTKVGPTRKELRSRSAETPKTGMSESISVVHPDIDHVVEAYDLSPEEWDEAIVLACRMLVKEHTSSPEEHLARIRAQIAQAGAL